ncbi:uncharacterized protein clmnb [Thunnus albacares]|uniref:uncharacterized protein clmnb n=1 Tax=Thunnus albacares TaxID=8236 RepID=UPI001CF66E73|nr:uncharacterized protein clmnb [Thunnus albacares]XP_044232206.1 uncharacterized protein clmnb [Thunnus albacares]
MRMEDEASWDSQGVRDQHVQQSQDERKAVQKRTFTRWMNMFLQRCEPPVEAHDLFTDIQDGRILMSLLEELSGCKLLYRFRSSSHRNFRLNNISKVLAFLDDRHVKLLGIDASGIADGIPSVVFNLIWNIILHFQVKEVTGGLQRHLSSSLTSLSMSSYPSFSDLSPQPNDIGSYSSNTLPRKGGNAAREPKYHGKVIKTLLQWVQRCTSQFGVEVHDFGKSWRSGLAFLAMIKSINPALVDLRESLSREPRENIHQAFMIAHHSLDIPPLLEPEDVACISPDEQSIITYVSMFLGHYSGIDENYTTDIEVNIPEIPNFGSLEALSFGETGTRDPEAKGLLRGLEKSSEQQLWKQWARRSSGGLHATLRHMNGAVTSDFSTSSDVFPSYRYQSITEQTAGTSQVNRKKGRCPSVLQPPSPLDTGVFSQDIRSWLEKGSVDQGHGKPKRDESYISLSSEEGIYNLSVLDSDEEDAYSYNLDLNKEVFQPYNHLKRIPRLEEETAEEIILNGQLIEESEHLEVSEMFNVSGCKHQEGSLAQNTDFDQELEVRALSVDHRKFDLEKNESIFREMANNRAVLDVHLLDESRGKGEHEEERAVTGQSNDDGEEGREKEKTENARLVRNGYNETESLVVEAAYWKTEVVVETEGELSEKNGQGSVKRDKEEEEEHLLMFKKGQNRGLRKERDEEDDVKEEERGNQQSVVNLQMMKTGNEKILIDKAEVRRTSVPTISTKEDSDGRDVKMENLTKNCKDEENQEDTNEVKYSMDFETVDEKDRELERCKHLTEKKATIIHHPGATTLKNDTDGGVHGHDGDINVTCRATSQSFSEGGFVLQSLAASCDITPLELEMLLFLWILLYCCLILPQMNH